MWKFFLAHAVRARGSDGHQNVLSQIGYSHMLENSESKKLGVFKTTQTQKQQNNPTKTKPTQPQKCVLPPLSLLHHLPPMASIAWRRSLLSLPCVWTLLVPVLLHVFGTHLMFNISFGCCRHNVSNTFVQLTEGRSARDQPKQLPAKKKNQLPGVDACA